MSEFQSGFVGIVGPTNAGKSTLLNALMGRKVSIVSDRSQTTYHGIRGIHTTEAEQRVYVDTPGFQSNPQVVARLLNKVADRCIKECDVLLWIVDASNPRVLKQLERLKQRIENKGASRSVCVLNKVDKVSKPDLLPLIASIDKQFAGLFCAIVPVSATKKDGLERLEKLIGPLLPEGAAWYPADQWTDRSQDFVLSEFIREKIYSATWAEIPYAVKVEIENWESPLIDSAPQKIPTVRAALVVDSDSRRGILIGRGGQTLKKIGVAARKEIEAYLGHRVHLLLHVRVQAGWREDSRAISQYLELGGP